ncbi:MAG: adenylate/guanylate cyclase domain-containing protein, partial [Bacteroidota bacterium]
KEYEAAKSQFRKTEKICAQKAYVDLVDLYTNMGINYNNQGNAIEALQYLQKANRLLHRKKGKAQAKAYISNLIATVYLQSKDVYNALQYNKEAMRVAKEGGNARLLSECYKTAAEAHEDLYAYDIALDYYQKHLALQDSFLLVERLRQQELLQQQLSLEREEKRNSLLMAEKEVQELTIRQLKLEADTFRLESQAREDEIRLLKIKEENLITDQRNKALEEEKEQQALRLQAQNLRLKAQRLEVENKDRALSELRQAERVKALEQMNLERQNEVLKKDKDILTRDKQLLTQQQQLDRSELERQEQFQQFAYGFVALLFLILSLILAGLFYTRKANLKLARQNKQIEKQKAEIEKSHTEVEQERHKSEALLLNILPAEMAMELKEMGGATPRHYDKVTVMFTDFSGFTRIAESMSPQDLIEELNVCFRAFDQIIENHNLEKIKTMGDAYMCAGGIPVPNEGNPYDAVAAALEMLDYMDERYAEKQALGQEYWRMRIGIHTGQVVAGVVGLKRFAYDIWGDTVNLASRLESSGEDGKINISGATHEWIKQVFHCTYRGKIAIKNKAAVSMYFVERLPVSAKVDQHSA